MDKSQKAQIRVTINDTIDQYCKECKKVTGMERKEADHFCKNRCQIGRHLQKLGKMLEIGKGKAGMEKQEAEQEQEKVVVTKENYERLKAEGKSNAEIARIFGFSDAALYHHLEKWGLHKKRKAAGNAESDPVKRPSHYIVGGIETIDYIRAKMTPEEFAGFCRGNVLKYVSRAPHKNGLEDLKKARWYLDRLIELQEVR